MTKVGYPLMPAHPGGLSSACSPYPGLSRKMSLWAAAHLTTMAKIPRSLIMEGCFQGRNPRLHGRYPHRQWLFRPHGPLCARLP